MELLFRRGINKKKEKEINEDKRNKQFEICIYFATSLLQLSIYYTEDRSRQTSVDEA